MIDTFSQDFNNIESSDDEKPDCESNIFIRKLTSSPSVNEIETIKEDVKEDDSMEINENNENRFSLLSSPHPK